MNLRNYVNEILSIAEENGNVAFDVGVDMFINNIEDARYIDDQYYYAGADFVNYELLNMVWGGMTQEEKDFAKADVIKWYGANREILYAAYMAQK